jgi:hypothetical protein
VCSHSTGGVGRATGGGPRRRQRKYDVVSLGNLCVDIVLPVPSLPPSDNGQFSPFANTVAKDRGLHESRALGNEQTSQASCNLQRTPGLAFLHQNLPEQKQGCHVVKQGALADASKAAFCRDAQTAGWRCSGS